MYNICPMLNENYTKQLIEQWLPTKGYAIASRRMELLAQILLHLNPEFTNSDFSQLRVLDIGCGGVATDSVESEHQHGGFELWEPWFLRIAWLLKAQTADGIDVVDQPNSDKELDIYNHQILDLYTCFANGYRIQDALGIQEGQYNLINCTNVVDATNPSPYLENLLTKLGIDSNIYQIITYLIEYIKSFALYALSQNGLLAIDKKFYIKKENCLVELKPES